VIHPDVARVTTTSLLPAPGIYPLLGTAAQPSWVGDFETLSLYALAASLSPWRLAVTWWDMNTVGQYQALQTDLIDVAGAFSTTQTVDVDLPTRQPWVTVAAVNPATLTLTFQARLSNRHHSRPHYRVPTPAGLLPPSMATTGVLFGSNGSSTSETIAPYAGRAHLWAYATNTSGAASVTLTAVDYLGNTLGVIGEVNLNVVNANATGTVTAPEANIELLVPPSRIIATLTSTLNVANRIFVALQPEP
jgi:hypothetical protein